VYLCDAIVLEGTVAGKGRDEDGELVVDVVPVGAEPARRRRHARPRRGRTSKPEGGTLPGGATGAASAWVTSPAPASGPIRLISGTRSV
jgi:hypothetical protein